MESSNTTISKKKSDNSFSSNENDFVDNLFRERGIRFTKNSNGEYDIGVSFHLIEFPELITDRKLIIKFGKVSGAFDCSYCNLTSLEGCPKEVGSYFYCSECVNLTSLEGAPKTVGGNFNCSNCQNLTSLEGCPREVWGNFYCVFCRGLKSLKGAPERVGRSFYCYDCGVKFTEDDVKEHCKVSEKIFVQFF